MKLGNADVFLRYLTDKVMCVSRFGIILLVLRIFFGEIMAELG